MELILGLVFSVGALAGMLAMVGVIWTWRQKERVQGRRHPLTRHLLRAPGQSVREQIDDLRWDLAAYLSVAMLPIPVTFGIYLSGWAAKGKAPSAVQTALLSIIAIGALIGLGVKLWRILRRLRRLRIGYDAEVAVGQELNELMRRGFRVFHDFPADKQDFNIDHVIVGPSGVFAIETKGRTKPKATDNGTASWEAIYDGTTLQFPGWREKGPMRQADAAGTWLRQWLSKAVGKPVIVQPVVVLPGWFIKRTGPNGIPVIASGQIPTFFASGRSLLDEEMIQRIAHQLEQQCRDVEPSWYRESRKADG